MLLTEITNQMTRDEKNPMTSKRNDEVDFGNSRVMIVKVHNSLQKGISIYDATRGVWNVSKKIVQVLDNVEYVVGINGENIEAVFKPKEWHPASEDKELLKVFTEHNFLPKDLKDRYAFTGEKINSPWIGKKYTLEMKYPTDLTRCMK